MAELKKYTSSEDPVDQLRRILLADNLKSVADLESRIESFQVQWRDKNWLIKTLDPVIAGLLTQKISESKDEIAEALAPVMGTAIKKQIEVAREDIVDALYPVIGQSIRKSIAEAMKNLAKTVNERVDRALSFEMMFKKLKARITGVESAALVLADSLPFTIHEIFYIHKESGLLLTHVHDRSSSASGDEDMISGMLSAIREFAKTAFSENSERDLSEIQYDDLQILLENGRNAYLAVVTSGVPPKELKDYLRQLEQNLHKQYFKSLREFKGDTEPFNRVRSDLESFLQQYNRKRQSDGTGKDLNRRPKGLMYLLTILLLALIVYAGIFFIPQKFRESELKASLNELRQKNPELLSNIRFEINDRHVTLAGEAENWSDREKIESLMIKQAGVKEVSNDINVRNRDIEPEKIWSGMKALYPGQLEDDLGGIRFIVDGNRLFLEGETATGNNKILIGSAAAQITRFPVVINNLKVKNREDLSADFIRSVRILFDSGSTNITAKNIDLLDEIEGKLKTANFTRITVIGHADPSGSDKINYDLSMKRAENVRRYLINHGFPEAKITVIAKGAEEPILSDTGTEMHELNRRVTFLIE
ncbi:MAG: OmpA family protein [Calditrichaceae bacterium]